MRQATKTEHVLEMRDRPNGPWHAPEARIYQPAQKLAWQGRLVEAIDTAGDIRLAEYDEMHGITFRVVTTAKTVTVLGPWEDTQ